MNKINWDDYFLTMCFLVAQRSIDPSTKCGAVLVSADRRILSTGYNGPIKGVNDAVIPLDRPAKYAHLLHAEENCIIAYNGSSQDLVDSTMYVTGSPCHNCLRIVLQKGIRNIICTDGNAAVMHNEAEEEICQKMIKYTPNVNFTKLPNLLNIMNILHITENYLAIKNPDVFSLSKVVD